MLQDIKSLLKERYATTDISGDGQVVVIGFNKYTVELVPGFIQNDGSFLYPDTHDGGAWKKTNPIPEQKVCKSCNSESNGIYFDFCHMLRSWKNNKGLSVGGFLIDTFVYDYFSENDSFKSCGYEDYLSILISVFEYLKRQKKDQTFWYAPGSNQKIYNPDKGAFVDDANDAYDTLNDLTNNTEGINDRLIDLFGVDFPRGIQNEVSAYRVDKYAHIRGARNEVFIEEIFPVDIRFFS